MLHHRLVGRVQSKESYFMVIYPFLVPFCWFSSKNLCWYHYHFFFFFDKVSNFHNMLTSQKPELVIRNCQWNCMHWEIVFTGGFARKPKQTFLDNFDGFMLLLAL